MSEEYGSEPFTGNILFKAKAKGNIAFPQVLTQNCFELSSFPHMKNHEVAFEGFRTCQRLLSDRNFILVGLHFVENMKPLPLGKVLTNY